MESLKAYVEGARVLASGLIIVEMSETLRLDIFPNHPDESVTFKFVISDNAQPIMQHKQEDGNLCVTYERPWSGGALIGNVNGMYESNDRSEFIELRFTTRLMGSPNRFVVSFSYCTIAR